MKRVLKVLLAIVGALVLFVVLGLGYLTIVEYRPADRSDTPVSGTANKTAAPGDTLTVLAWNTGYSALGDNADFFMDGGSMVMTADEARVRENLAAQIAFVQNLDPDLCLLQEVDRDSKRSYHIDAQAAFTEALSGFASAWATNYQAFVPYPWPMIGQVNSGLLTLSALPITEAERISLPNTFSWPVRLGMLKRCLLTTRIQLEGTDKELVVINLHVEAYDEGEAKTKQTELILQTLNDEIVKGNYVVAGGDFNQTFSEEYLAIYPLRDGMWTPPLLDESAYGEKLTLLTDASVPTCRSLDQPLVGANLDSFQYYVIDGFIISSNIRADLVETQDLGFVNSDHKPVLLTLTLLEEE